MESVAANIGDTTQAYQNEDINEIRSTEGIKVWGADQEVLENQALQQLKAFAQANDRNTESGLEDGEITDETAKPSEIKSLVQNNVLDIQSYIQKQEELRKRQEYVRTLQVSEKSKAVAEQAVRKQRKRKKSKSSCVTKEKLPKLDAVSVEKEVDGMKSSDSEYVPSEDLCSDSDYEADTIQSADNVPPKIKKRLLKVDLKKVKDDGSISCYKSRLDKYYQQLENERNILNAEDDDEIFHIGNGLKVPCSMWKNLYSYQQAGVEWLWEMHQKKMGGLLGDEMGLGKTVQIIVFLHALNYSRIISGRYTGLGPTLIVSPATVIHQWVKHFHEWAPEFRVAVLHQSGSYAGNKTNLIKEIHKEKGIIITTYVAILKYKGLLCERDWHYVILDEGHKIRNPDAKVSIAVKQIRTPHRIILTGSPMQNNLQELWSLFDFVNPGLLGNLPTFMEHFANPIMHGGYMNATPMQEATALSVAMALKDTITPYLLRRVKNDVKNLISLPSKSEQVLFCSLTDEQKDLYKGYLLSEQVSMIIGRGGKNWFSENQTRANVLVAITTLRKICNHPDLYLGEFDENNRIHTQTIDTPPEDTFGHYKRSGKMVVVSALLKIWKKQGHRVLLFTQSRSMVTIFEEFLSQQGYTYLKMDGSTSVSSRQPLIEKFNTDQSCDVFLLTTRVGGLGVNLTGANRVIIYDPDWNPATDTQARERAWRIGQEKQVTVYRLLTAGTIEEKMYQRQVWKQLLSNKVLIDPRTQRFFRASDLHDLFSLQEQTDANPETSNIFRNSKVQIQEKLTKRKNRHKSAVEAPDIQFSDDKIQAMKLLAQQIAKNITSGQPDEKVAPKTSYQKELEEERKQKLKEKEFLKTLRPAELRALNRKKLEKLIEDERNKIDGRDTSLSFSKALDISEETAKLYHQLKSDGSGPSKETSHNKDKNDESTVEDEIEKVFESGESQQKCNEYLKTDQMRKKHKTRRKYRQREVDKTGKIDGEVVEGLVKREVKNTERKEDRTSSKNQDDYVLGKLFSKKGVHMALQHDIIVQSTREGNIKLHYEAEQRADKALQALRKSRIDNWRW